MSVYGRTITVRVRVIDALWNVAAGGEVMRPVVARDFPGHEKVALAEDLMQETWLRLARSAPELPAHTELRPWLFTVARNLYRSHRRWAVLDGERLRELGWLPSAAWVSPFEQLAADRTERALEQAIPRLPLEQREVSLLCGVSGFEPRQVASMLGVTPEAVRQRPAPPAPRAQRWSAYYYRVVEPTALLVLGLSFVISSFQASMALLH